MKAKIQEDLKVAMKAREKHKVVTLRGIVSELKKVEIDTREELTEDVALGVLQKEVKKRRDTIRYAKEGGREDLIEQNETEIEIIQKYLGAPLGDDELREVIKQLVDEGAAVLGQVMGALNKSYKGRFDGRMASAIAKEMLG